ncbi:thyrotropin-releasing hormone-degrading ectoenzyme-like [Microplitis demolitor]|uniref:thyrotropin-releasing hormone-degrading ectoenzyme-like n=1 Tax=Microplitis demolitor TaxID=69319 RepID=UPI00235B5E0E|nr:thyrotropin-releasing hormone-degrading ectoenzyme-like [Microplitis demolitor]
MENLLPVGNYSLKLRWNYYNYSQETGLFRVMNYNKSSTPTYIVMGTKNLRLIKARNLFPCWDEPIYKAEFEISLKHPKNLTALSNMPVKNNYVTEDKNIVTCFNKTPRLSPHSIGVAITNYPVTHSVIMTGKEDGCINNLGLIFYKNKLHGISSKPLSPLVLYQNKEFQDLKVTTALTLQWFTEIVTPIDFNYLWLFLAIGHNTAAKINDQMYQKLRRMEMQVMEIFDYHFDLEFKSLPPMSEISAGDQSYISQNSKKYLYIKGITLMLMLEHTVTTSEVYQTGLQNYLKNNLFKTATLDDLWNSLQHAYNNRFKNSPRNIKNIIDCWVQQPGYPIINITRNYDTGFLRITQKNVLKNFDNSTWIIPLNYAIKSNPKLPLQDSLFWITDKETTVFLTELKSDDWIIFNVQQFGHYRVNYDSENWKRIIDYLNSDNYDKINPINRGVVISEIEEIYNNNNDLEKLINLLWYLRRERDIIPLMKAVGPLNTVSKIMTIDRKIINSYINNILSPIISYLNNEYENNEYFYYTAYLRLQFLRLYCPINYEKCKSLANRIYNELISNSTEKRHLDEYFYSWSLCIAIRDFNEKQVDYFFSSEFPLLRRNPSDKFMYLHCIKNYTIIKNHFARALSTYAIIFPKKIIEFVDTFIFDNKFTGDIEFLLDYFINNYTDLEGRFSSEDSREIIPSLILRLNTLIAGIKQWEKLKAFIESRASELNDRYPVFKNNIIQELMLHQSLYLQNNIKYSGIIMKTMSKE